MGFSRQEYWSGLPNLFQNLSEFSTITHPSWVALPGMAHSFIEIDKAVVHVISLVSFLWLWFSSVGPLMDKVKKINKLPDGRDWLRGKLGLVLMGGAMFNKSLIQFSIDGQDCVPSLLLDLRSNYGGGNEDNCDLLQKVPCTHCCTQCPQPCSRPPPTVPPLETPGHSRASLGESLVGSLLLCPGSSCAQGSVCALQESVSPVLCNFILYLDKGKFLYLER